ncbi:zinc finger ZZ-type and EF-hand domain-containing protein 1-like [Glandiceps talaboti]
MGNANSNSDSDDEFMDIDELPEDEDTGISCIEDHFKGFDLAMLFDHTSLRDAASKIKDELPENVVQQHHSHLVRWLEDRQTRNEETISLTQFCDFLMNRSVGREECIDAFNQFDTEGDGTADVQTMLDALKSSNGANLQGELNFVIRTLQGCSLIPGLVDVYSPKNHVSGQHGKKLLKYLLRNRAPSTCLPFPLLDGFNNISSMRLSVLKTHLKKLRETVHDRQETTSIINSGEEVKVIHRCYRSVEVSTNKGDVLRLSNGDPASYWQSDGSARSHWVRLRMKSNVVLKQLSINVASVDQSYMPQLVSVSVGKVPTVLVEIKEVRIPCNVTGDVLLIENAKLTYPYVQINIKRCHSDGCDTRIHGFKTIGYRMVQSGGISVCDASAVWYLSVLASTATAAIPMAPQLRTSIIEHTRSALSHMPPLSLSSASSERPSFLTPPVLDEIERFLYTVSLDSNGKVSPEGIHVLLSFALARGHVPSLLKSLHYMQEYGETPLEAITLLRSLNNVREMILKKYGSILQLSLCGCDGGQRDSNTAASNVLTDNWTTEAYLSGNDRLNLNLVFSSKDSGMMQITRARIKVYKGGIGPKAGLIFVYNDEEAFDMDKHVERFKAYDCWTTSEYNFLQKMRSASLVGKSDNPVAFFNVEEDWDEVDIPMDSCQTGKYVLIKFLGARSETAERLGIVGVKLYGYHRTSSAIDNINLSLFAPMPDKMEGMINSDVVFLRVLQFIVDMGKDLVIHISPEFPQEQEEVQKKKEKHLKGTSLDMSGVTMALLSQLYSDIPDGDNKWIYGKVLTLKMIHLCLPQLTREIERSNDVIGDDPDKITDAVMKKARTELKCASVMFDTVRDIVDTTMETEDMATSLMIEAAKNAILDGAAVFFPNKDLRRQKLFTMMQHVMDPKETSAFLTFRSLCRYYSSVDPSGLLTLPSTSPKEDFDIEPVLSVMETLLSVAFRECEAILEGKELKDVSSNLVQLLCALQTSLMSWCHEQLQSENTKHREPAVAMILRYCGMQSDKACSIIDALCKIKNKDPLIDQLEKSFLATSLRQLILSLALLSEYKLPSISLLKNLQPISEKLRTLAPEMPKVFHDVDSDAWRLVNQENVVLRTWNIESTHNYENNLHITQIFFCPGATSFHVEFDTRCETEKRYDYLEFTDARGFKQRFDQKVGSEKWPKTVNFKGGPRLQFLFHSDSSNNEWGYKFTVTAKGCPDVSLSWLFDLQLGLAKLFGKLCASVMDSRQVTPKSSSSESSKSTEDQEEAESSLLRSDIWSTLFRGGYMVGKLTRSLSGNFMTNPSDSVVNSFLGSVSTGESGMASDFLDKCHNQRPVPSMGGPAVDSAIKAVFAALLWHTQDLRDEIEKYYNSEGELPVSDGILQAYVVAETIRTYLIDLRQKFKVASEKEEKEKDQKKDPDEPVTICLDKAMFLLKFAGLSKQEPKQEEKVKSKRNLMRSRSYQIGRNRLPSQDSTDRDTNLKGRYILTEEDSSYDRYPSFKLVMDFVKNALLTRERVRHLLDQRCQRAQALADIFMFAAEFLRINGNPHFFQVPSVLFLQEMLSAQKHFPVHYAIRLEGCGLDLESKVRRSYYALVRRLSEAVISFDKTKHPRSTQSAFECMQALLLHLLDVDWQPYDLHFVADLQIPALLLQISKTSVGLRDSVVSEKGHAKEVEDYKQCKDWLRKCTAGFIQWYTMIDNARADQKRAMHMFVARYCDMLDVEITCDGCAVLLPGQRYRCLHCEDMDLCNTCYLGGVKPEGHNDDHEMVHLMYKCDNCQAFIVGTRIHCNVCDDFDLCYGCYDSGAYPSSHKSFHENVIIPLKIVSNTNQMSTLPTYLHHHSWIQFAALALSLADTINNPQPHVVSSEYLKFASQLHQQCIELCITSLTFAESSVTKDEKKDKGAEKVKEVSKMEEGKSDETTPDKVADGDKKDEVSGVKKDEEVAATKEDKKEDEAKRDSGTSTEKSEDKVSGEVDKAAVAEEDGKIAEAKGGDETAAVKDVKATAAEDDKRVVAKDDTEESEEEPKSKKARTEEDHAETKDKIDDDRKATSTSSADAHEVAFAGCSQERILGLLGSMLPQNGKTAACAHVMESFKVDTILPMLFAIARGEKGHDNNTQHLALGLLGQVLQRLTPEVCDKAIKTDEQQKDDSSAVVKYDGSTTAQFLFTFGASCLERSGLEWASVMSDVLQRLCHYSYWKSSLANNISKCLQDLPQVPKLSSIFALFVVAGFPEVLTLGTPAIHTEASGDTRECIILKHISDVHRAIIVDTKMRKRKHVKEYQVQCKPAIREPLDEERLARFLNIAKDILGMSKQGKVMSVENMWVLALTLKAILANLQSTDVLRSVTQLLDSGLVPSLVHMASKGTGFSRQWLLKDLEILSVMLYTGDKSETVVKHHKTKPIPKKKHATIPEHRGSDDDNSDSYSDWTTDSSDSSSSSSDDDDDDELKNTPSSPTKTPGDATAPTEPVGGLDPLDGLEENTKICFQITNDALKAPLSVLRAMYEANGRQTNLLLDEVQKCFDGDMFHVSDHIKDLAKKWEPLKPPVLEDMENRVVDIGVISYTPTKTLPKQVNVAIEEPNDGIQKLISTPETEMKQSYGRQQRSKSSTLLRKELETHGKSGSRPYLCKVNTAITIIYARHVLSAVLADWPGDNYIISCQSLGCNEHTQLVSAIDLLQRAEDKGSFFKVVRNAVQYCKPELLTPLSLAACHFMEEVNLCTETKESEHPYKNNTTAQDKINIPNAIFLTVKFDARCATEDGCDELIISSSPDYKQDKHVFSGSARDKWIDFDVPGDTLYYKFSSDCSTNDWGYKFTVTGGKMGRFETGYVLLNTILTESSLSQKLPLDELWCWLVYVSCRQTGQQRLKVIQLMLRILQLLSSVSMTSATPVDKSHHPDLTLLRPLWLLLNKMAKETPKDSSTKILPPVQRALTELFLWAENLAMEWGIQEEYMVAMVDEEDLKKVAAQAIQNIAALGMALGIPNKASDAFRKVKPVAV